MQNAYNCVSNKAIKFIDLAKEFYWKFNFSKFRSLATYKKDWMKDNTRGINEKLHWHRYWRHCNQKRHCQWERKILFSEITEAFFDNYKTSLWETTLRATKNIHEKAKSMNVVIQWIGFSVTGDVDTNTNKIIGGCESIPNCENIEIEKDVTEILGEKVKIAAVNYANAATIAEQWLGNAKGFDDVIVYTIGTGIGRGIFVNGKILNDLVVLQVILVIWLLRTVRIIAHAEILGVSKY